MNSLNLNVESVGRKRAPNPRGGHGTARANQIQFSNNSAQHGNYTELGIFVMSSVLNMAVNISLKNS